VCACWFFCSKIIAIILRAFHKVHVIMPLTLIGGGIKRWCCLTSVCLSDVCLSRTSGPPKLRTERPTKTKICTDLPMSHVTRTPLLMSRVKGQGHQATLLSAALTRQPAAAVTVGTYWPWEPILLRCGLQAPSARRREALRCPTREESGWGILWRRSPTACQYYNLELSIWWWQSLCCWEC